jgi:hypothetical protein
MRHLLLETSVFIFMLSCSAGLLYADVNCSAAGIVCTGGTLTANAAWNSSNVYVIQSDLIVSAGVTLTIGPGTIVKFRERSSETGLVIDGTLNVNGTSNSKVYFTSLRDDSAGGDTNADGSSTSPSPDDWKRIYFRANSSGTISYVELRYAGGYYASENYGAIHIDGASPSLSNITVRYCAWSAISAGPSDQPTITNLTALSTPFGGLEIRGGSLSANASWSQPVVYILTEDVTVANGVILTIGSGTVVKFRERSSETGLIVDGTLNVNGTSSSKVYFTSLRDESVGGDTNGDGSSTSPSPDDWKRIYFRANSSGTISYAELRYAGNSSAPLADFFNF